MARFSRLPIVAQAVVLALRADADERDGPRGRRTIHLLPVLMADRRPPSLPPLPPAARRRPATAEHACCPPPAHAWQRRATAAEPPRAPRASARRSASATRRPDEQRRLSSAGHALVVCVLALAIGLLLNAPGAHKTAYNQPAGWKRDVALAVTGPLAASATRCSSTARVQACRRRSAAAAPTRSTRRSRSRRPGDDSADAGPKPATQPTAAHRSEAFSPHSSCGSGSPATRS